MSTFDKLLALVDEQPLSRNLPAVLRVTLTTSDQDLANWVRLELMGYFAENPAMTDDIVVPEYRGVVGQWYDDYDHLFVLPDQPDLSFINEVRLRQGVAELEGFGGSGGVLTTRPTELAQVIRQSLNVDVSIFRFESHSCRQVLLNIKASLIDRLSSRREAIDSLSEKQVTQTGEVLQLKPSIYGVGIDLKALWRRMFRGKQ